MALQNEYTSSYGTLHDEAYSKIDFIRINCHKKTMDVVLSTWGSKESRDVNNFSFTQEKFEELPCEPTSSTNIVKQAYDIVKHDLVFTGSLDV